MTVGRRPTSGRAGLRQGCGSASGHLTGDEDLNRFAEDFESFYRAHVWSDTATGRILTRDMDAIDWLAKYELYSPDKTAIVETESGKRFTFRELSQQANRYAQLFTNLGLKSGDRVSVLLPNGAEILFVLFAATKRGIIFLPLNHKLAAPELAQIIEDAAPGLMIYDSQFRTL